MKLQNEEEIIPLGWMLALAVVKICHILLLYLGVVSTIILLIIDSISDAQRVGWGWGERTNSVYSQ